MRNGWGLFKDFIIYLFFKKRPFVAVNFSTWCTFAAPFILVRMTESTPELADSVVRDLHAQRQRMMSPKKEYWLRSLCREWRNKESALDAKSQTNTNFYAAYVQSPHLHHKSTAVWIYKLSALGVVCSGIYWAFPTADLQLEHCINSGSVNNPICQRSCEKLHKTGYHSKLIHH